MATFNGSVKVALQGLFENALDVGKAVYDIAYNFVLNYATGTGSGQANQVWTDTRTLTASSSENLDLAGSLVDAFGTTITFAKIKAVMITAASGNTNGVQVTRPASNGVPLFMAASDGIQLEAGDCFMFAGPVGKTVTAGTGDILTITNSAGSTSVTYTIEIVGTV